MQNIILRQETTKLDGGGRGELLEIQLKVPFDCRVQFDCRDMLEGIIVNGEKVSEEAIATEWYAGNYIIEGSTRKNIGA